MNATRLGVVVGLVVLVSGCIEAVGVLDDELAEGTLYAWTWTLEPSMNPDFAAAGGETFAALLLHDHVLLSKRQEEYYKEHPVVCSSAGLEEVLVPITSKVQGLSSPAAADMAACMPIADPATGRLFMEPEEFDELGAMAVAIRDPTCYGELYAIQSASPGLNEKVGPHTFRIEFLANGTVLVDGSHHIPAGRTLKASYWVAGDDPSSRDDDFEVRAVFDYPGRWLRSLVAMPEDGEIPPPRPPEGNGPEAFLNRTAESFAEILAPLVQATPGSQRTLSALRVVRAQDVLVDVSAQVTSENGTTHWFVAGGGEDALRLLGKTVPPTAGAPRADYGLFVEAFDEMSLSEYASGTVLTFTWSPERALETASPIPWAETWVPPTNQCAGDCAFVWAADPFGDESWRAVEHPAVVNATEAFTLSVRSYAGAGEDEFDEALFFRPG